MEAAAGHQPSEKTATTLTAVLHACAAHVSQHDDQPAILPRQRDAPALLRLLLSHSDPRRGLHPLGRSPTHTTAHSMRSLGTVEAKSLDGWSTMPSSLLDRRRLTYRGAR